MTFLSLYRKYRPRTFEDLVGQQHVVQTLKNALNQNRIGHAYLFAGPRGTGKTSTAKIFAQALNCVEGPTVDPCGVCDSCSSIISGQSVDVIEIDAASNRGIDEIRDLREKVKFLPTVGKYKVYIIDEVHMLTKGAFNALLKTLEEPPSNVVFILATTEAHKVLDTILSRCQRFDFTLLSSADIVSRLEYICQQEKVNYDREALNLITGASMGGLRDAISLLDQAISYTDGNLTREAIQEMLGKVDLSFLRSFVEGVLARDTAAILKMTGEIIDSGKSISVFVEDLINFLHQAMLLKECGRDTSIFNLTEEMYSQLEGVARGVDTARLIRFLDILTEVERQLPFADQPRIILELGLIKMTAGTGDNQLADLENRLRELEEKVEELSRG
ncbi:MAG: DNA polymerase III subunit gamma/tau, partial [Halanaerobiaceae bacterium]|nr:DNA polymerase III subunit gamma/tau [Halanaerobiaceae bacterium]